MAKFNLPGILPKKNFDWKNQRHLPPNKSSKLCKPLIRTPGDTLSGFFHITSYTWYIYDLIYASMPTENKTPEYKV